MKYLSICFLILTTISLLAQEQFAPQRTASDIAHKQTEMLVRELNITDSTLRDTLFHMHLKYVEMQTDTLTRADMLNCMELILKELQQILSPEQYEAFMNRQLNITHRFPHSPCSRLIFQQQDEIPSHLSSQESNKQTIPQEHQQANHQ